LVFQSDEVSHKMFVWILDRKKYSAGKTTYLSGVIP
jgi:hypothetical protein